MTGSVFAGSCARRCEKVGEASRRNAILQYVFRNTGYKCIDHQRCGFGIEVANERKETWEVRQPNGRCGSMRELNTTRRTTSANLPPVTCLSLVHTFVTRSARRAYVIADRRRKSATLQTRSRERLRQEEFKLQPPGDPVLNPILSSGLTATTRHFSTY